MRRDYESVRRIRVKNVVRRCCKGTESTCHLIAFDVYGTFSIVDNVPEFRKSSSVNFYKDQGLAAIKDSVLKECSQVGFHTNFECQSVDDDSDSRLNVS